MSRRLTLVGATVQNLWGELLRNATCFVPQSARFVRDTLCPVLGRSHLSPYRRPGEGPVDEELLAKKPGRTYRGDSTKPLAEDEDRPG